MGVQGLWKLLESTGRPVSLESLEGKILAVDVSLWLHQAMRGMRDEGGNIKANAHLHVLFNRICKLLFYRIRPIFVFDGSVPELKRQTMVARRQRREIAAGKSKKTSEKLIKNYLQSHALHAVLGEAGGSGQVKTAPVLKKIVSTEPNMYELPPVPPVVWNESESDSDAEVDLLVDSLSHHHHQNLEDVDIESEDFKALPPEMQHEMIIEMKENRKRNSWETIKSLPAKSEEFSDYQLKKLLQKGKMTQRLYTLRKEMSNRNAGEIASMLDLESGGSNEVEAGRIISEDAHHYLLVKRQSKMADSTQDGDVCDQDNDSKPDAVIQSFPPDEPKIKGHVSSVDVKGQEDSSQMLQEPDVIVVSDSKPDEGSANRETDIAQIVKNFFIAVPKTSSASQVQIENVERVETVSPDVIVLDRGDIVGQRSCDGQNIIRRSNEEGVTVVDTHHKSLRNDKIVFHGDDEVIILDDGLDQSKLSINCDLVTHSTNQSRVPSNLNIARKLGTTEIERSLSPKEMRSKMSQPASSAVTSVEDEDVGDKPTASSSKKTTTNDTLSERDVKRKNVKDGGNLEVSRDSSSDDDDFIEITVDQVSHTQEDELFPASVFMPSADMSKDARAASPTIDINPQESRNDHDIIAMETALLVDENEAREAHQGVVDDEIDTVEDDEEIHEDETEGQDDIEMELQRDAARQEWEAMNVKEVSSLEGTLETQRAELQTERGKQDRVAASVTDLMYSESKELLELFGIPYIVSPEEAEAQCAFLDMTDQTSGTITDDSDVWLFGGRVVYRNFFSKGKDVECFKDVNVEKQMLLDRSKLVTLAMLLGSDYTDGVTGIGWVTAMEVLTEFPGEGIDLLKSFKSWWDVAHKQLMPPVESQLKGKLRKLTLSSSFPCQRVISAYWNPVVDESTEKFTWQSPDLGLLRDFARDKLGWTRSKADETLLPVIKRLNEKKIQGKISSFFHLETQPRQVTSKRLKRVLNHLRNPQQAKEEEAEKIKQGGTKSGRGRKTATVAKEITSKKTKQSSNVRNRKKFSKGGNNVDVCDEVSMETIEERNENVERNRKGHRRTLKMKTEDDKSDSASDTQSSEDEYVLPKKAKIVLEDSGSADAGRRRGTRRKMEVVDYNEEKVTSEEFLEIGETMSQKTEGCIGYNFQRKNTNKLSTSGTSTLIARTDNQREQFGAQGGFTASVLKSDSPIIKSKQFEVTKHSSQVNKTKGRQVKGQRGKGKGHPGQREKGKAVSLKGGRTKVGPKLSESSSSDSD